MTRNFNGEYTLVISTPSGMATATTIVIINGETFDVYCVVYNYGEELGVIVLAK